MTKKLQDTDPGSWIPDPDPLVRGWIRGSRSGSGSTPKCHGAGPLEAWFVSTRSYLRAPDLLQLNFSGLENKCTIWLYKLRMMTSTLPALIPALTKTKITTPRCTGALSFIALFWSQISSRFYFT